ncbi:MAG: hypothetical protein KJ697_00660 [Nanoarchaeota archaeon]|nr:hypothetical protein [Nanoarchaeota archaeon]
MAKKKFKLNAGAIWFLAILVVSVLAAVFESGLTTTAVWLILGICGAMIAIYNIRDDEEKSFLIAVGTLYIIVVSWFIVTVISEVIPLLVYNIFVNLLIGLGVAGFIVAMGLILKIAIQK